MVHWFDQLRTVLRNYYPQDGPADVVGYLRGSANPNDWRIMMFQRQRHQMMILGSIPPNREEWSAAGVASRGGTQTIRLNDLNEFIILYGGFILRPWGHIYVLSAEALHNYQSTIDSFRRNLPKAPRD